MKSMKEIWELTGLENENNAEEYFDRLIYLNRTI